MHLSLTGTTYKFNTRILLQETTRHRDSRQLRGGEDALAGAAPPRVEVKRITGGGGQARREPAERPRRVRGDHRIAFTRDRQELPGLHFAAAGAYFSSDFFSISAPAGV